MFYKSWFGSSRGVEGLCVVLLVQVLIVWYRPPGWASRVLTKPDRQAGTETHDVHPFAGSQKPCLLGSTKDLAPSRPGQPALRGAVPLAKLLFSFVDIRSVPVLESLQGCLVQSPDCAGEEGN